MKSASSHRRLPEAGPAGVTPGRARRNRGGTWRGRGRTGPVSQVHQGCWVVEVGWGKEAEHRPRASRDSCLIPGGRQRWGAEASPLPREAAPQLPLHAPGPPRWALVTTWPPPTLRREAVRLPHVPTPAAVPAEREEAGLLQERSPARNPKPQNPAPPGKRADFRGVPMSPGAPSPALYTCTCTAGPAQGSPTA